MNDSGLPNVGSSPRAWGTRLAGLRLNQRRRFIPTGVGNTAAVRPPAHHRAVHPHGRGEHVQDPGKQTLLHGSSPRAWGTLTDPFAHARQLRFIPTGVGNTAPLFSSPSVIPVHPHGRGEHIWHRHPSRSNTGSSPRAWGTLAIRYSNAVYGRFIPTGVGNTQPQCALCSIASVHPHGRGEHARQDNPFHSYDGSSPRAWGTRRR